MQSAHPPDFANPRNVLTSEEIEALLRPDLSDMPPAPAETRDVALGDLDAPAPEDGLADEGARLAARLTLTLRQARGLAAGFDAEQSERLAFRAGVQRAAAHAAAVFVDEAGEVTAMLLLAREAGDRLVDIACGAVADAPAGGGDPAPATEIECALIAHMLAPAAGILGPEVRLLRVEGDAALAERMAPPDRAACHRFSLGLGGCRTRATLVRRESPLPAGPEALADAAPVPQPMPAGQGRGLKALLTARIARLTVPAGRIADLKPGATLLLGLPPDQPVELLSGGRDGEVIAEGDAGRRGAKVAVRLTRVSPGIGRS